MDFYVLLLLIVTFLVIKSYLKRLSTPTKNHQNDSIPIPNVDGSLPIIGHLLQTTLYPESFFDTCYKKYGPVFRIKMASWRVAVVCDRKLIKAIWNEKQMSAAHFLDKVQIEKGRSVNNDLFLTKIKRHMGSSKLDLALMTKYAENLMTELNQLKENNGNKRIDLVDVFHWYGNKVFSHVLFGVDISEYSQIYEDFNNFTYYSGLAASTAFFLPMWIVTWLYEKRMHRPTPILTKCLQKHLKDRGDEERFKLGQETDFLSDLASDGGVDGEALTLDQLSEAFLRLNDTASPNLYLAIVQTIVMLHKNPKWLQRARAEANRLIKDKDYQGMVDSEVLTSCFQEACRLNINFTGSTIRVPLENFATIGNFAVRDLDFVMTGGHVVNAGEGARGLFEDEKRYKPSRWFNRQIQPTSVSTFGGGTHLCPGKLQSIIITNVTLAHFLSHFELDMDKSFFSDDKPLDIIRSIKVQCYLNIVE